MLDQTTKRKIDSARQILVGKVPDPKAQVEQITTALIYKFMDDMDKENEEVGLKTQFFIDDWKKFSWTKILDNKLSGKERLDLYIQAITNMSKNPHIPQLFRDIFKGAFLPYNDPHTLSLFLKEINEFNYEHSENLGNAFEYLLSILGSQGDAGQFRTPRHIIDFIVEVVDPKKNETILDPSCGTAGFLISAYKHILKTNKEKPLTPDEKLKLMNNLAGYDISPDMVKLALVNMYLHGFQEPKIHEYDSLTSEKRWEETFDVVLANPPFMTPTGGIRPHKRFSIQANRAEVLFVDYIVEHLTIKGRAGIIVPEGIIFQSSNAYKQLRKQLVEDGLFAVVSLPAGVFNPYAGVKTSVLLFDNEISKKTKNFLFVKIQNDGFDLGAQRRENGKNDLPLALEVIKKYKSSFDDKKFSEDEKQIAHIVAKEKIIATGDYNLSGDRYKEITNFANQKWEMVELGEVLEYEQPTKYIVESVNYSDEYKTPVLTAGQTFILGYTDETEGIFPAKNLPVIIFDDFTTATKFVDFPFKVKSSAMKILHTKREKADTEFLFYAMQDIKFNHDTHKRYWISEYSKIKIPLPPIEVQKEIVEQIEVKQNAIDHAKAIIQNLGRERRYFGQALRKLEGVEWVELGNENIFKIESGGTPDTNNKDYWNGEINWATLVDLPQDDYITELKETKRKITELGLSKSSAKLLPKESILVSSRATIGRVAIAKEQTATNQGFKNIIVNDTSKALPYFVAMCMTSKIDEMKALATGGTFGEVSKSKMQKLKIPLPTLEIQKKLVAEAEKEQQIINANKQLIEIMEQKISDVLSEI